MKNYSRKTDLKWQKRWEETKLYKFDRSRIKDKLYCLEMFSYPSGYKLHVGHWYNYGLTDSWARMKRMQGYEVFQPMGFDAFGLPAENYAIQTGVHPQVSTENNIVSMRRQLREMGAMFDWDYELSTCDPEYYKWTQWLFLQLYKHDLAYMAEAPVNYCPSCQTVLANEQVVNGLCERCDAEVIQKNMTQWFFRITKYVERLLAGLDNLDWPTRTIAAQRNWIGKSIGSELLFRVADSDLSFKVFTTRADTLSGATYAVLAPEHHLVEQLTKPEFTEAVAAYQEEARKQTEVQRLSTEKEKTGVFIGSYAVHPLSGEHIPIWIADYVLASYGTGAVMAVPGHDTRDFAFATKYNLPIVRVITSETEPPLPFVEDGILINSGQFNGLNSEDARKKIVEFLQDKQEAEFKTSYRLRDWLISRQRYWGAPIPVIHCPHCGIVPVPEKDLPVELPFNVDYTPSGKPPLASNEEFYHTKCPICQADSVRDPNTLDTFVDSSWYFLRFPDNKNSNEPFNSEWINKMLPVDKYVGGPEHACMHLLYSRFINMALKDMGYVDFEEPFLSLTHQGIILGPDGKRMSKSRGNVISPDSYIDQFGSDILRVFLAFGYAYTEGGPWDENGIQATVRFIERVERLLNRIKDLPEGHDNIDKAEKEVNYTRHYAIKGITEDAHRMQFNTCISRLMELTNALYRYLELPEQNTRFIKEVGRDLMLLIAPFAPHFAEEMWEEAGYEYSIFNQQWPAFDPDALILDTVEIVLQINGKIRAHLEIPSSMDKKEIEEYILGNDEYAVHWEGKQIVKIIVVPGRLVNIVVR